MPTALTRLAALASLEREPLRNVVLLKHLAAYPDATATFRATDQTGTAHLVLLDTRASPYDRATYPTANHAALLASDHPTLTIRLLKTIPPRQNIIFKVSTADRAAVAARFPLEPKARYHSFTATHSAPRDPDVQIGRAPTEAASALFETQGHNRNWLQPLLATGKAFTCILEAGGNVVAACLAFEIYGQVWEIGGVVTHPDHRRRGAATRIVQTTLAVLSDRGLTPRYQVNAENRASLALADKLRLRRFLTLEHHLYTHGHCESGK